MLTLASHTMTARLAAVCNRTTQQSNVVLQLYKEFAATYKHWFELLLPRSNQKLVTGHHPSNRSFKIVAECPVIGQSYDGCTRGIC